jgi:Lrp/AsnC family transcriptional regulator
MDGITKSDLRLLRALQQNASLSQQELAELTGMSKTSCWRRIRDLEEAGYIDERVTLLNARKLGLKIHVLVSVSMVEHNDHIRHDFEKHVETLAPVTECYAVSGDWDYLLHVLTDDIETYNTFLNRSLLNHASVRSASSSFALKRVKYTTKLPIEGA